MFYDIVCTCNNSIFSTFSCIVCILIIIPFQIRLQRDWIQYNFLSNRPEAIEFFCYIMYGILRRWNNGSSFSDRWNVSSRTDFKWVLIYSSGLTWADGQDWRRCYLALMFSWHSNLRIAFPQTKNFNENFSSLG